MEMKRYYTLDRSEASPSDVVECHTQDTPIFVEGESYPSEV